MTKKKMIHKRIHHAFEAELLKKQQYQMQRLCLLLIYQVPFVQSVDNTIQWTNHNPLEKSIAFDGPYPLDGDSFAL